MQGNEVRPVALDARARLREMADQPLMWAGTRMEFVLQALLLGEVLGSDVRLEHLGPTRGILGPDGGGPPDLAWAAQVVGRILTTVPPPSPAPVAVQQIDRMRRAILGVM